MRLARRGGTIVQVGSALAYRSIPLQAAYCASKHGVIGLTRALALELAARRITVNAICPGSTDTGRWTELVRVAAKDRDVSEAEAEKQLLRDVPLGRVVKTGDVANLAVRMRRALISAFGWWISHVGQLNDWLGAVQARLAALQQSF